MTKIQKSLKLYKKCFVHFNSKPPSEETKINMKIEKDYSGYKKEKLLDMIKIHHKKT